MERATGIEPASEAWEASILPMNYARNSSSLRNRPVDHIVTPDGRATGVGWACVGVLGGVRGRRHSQASYRRTTGTLPRARYTEVAQPIGVLMPRPVVAAAIVDSLSDPTMLLACSRAYPQELRGQFELPGGKVEGAEDPVEALTREIAEELGARLTIGERVCPEGGQWWPILGGRVMGVWLAEVAPNSQEPRAGASHLEARWVPLENLAALPWIVADLPIVEAVVARCAR